MTCNSVQARNVVIEIPWAVSPRSPDARRGHTSWAVNCRWKVCCKSSMELARLTPPAAGRAARICCGAATSTPTMHTGSEASTT